MDRRIASVPRLGPAEIVLGLTLLGAALRFGTLNVQSIWLDESATMILVHRGFSGMFSHLSSTSPTPPLYYVLTWCWTKVVGAGPLGFRSLSALAGTLTIPVLYLAGKEDLPAGRPVGGRAGGRQPGDVLLLAGGSRLRPLDPLLRGRLRAVAARAAGARWTPSDAVGRSLGARAAHALLRRLPVPARGHHPCQTPWLAPGVGADRRRCARRHRTAATGHQPARRRARPAGSKLPP